MRLDILRTGDIKFNAMYLVMYTVISVTCVIFSKM